MYWKPYVPVADRQAKAKKKVEKLKKKGMEIAPIEIEGKKIARQFWGKLWCDHIESFSDLESRLPRGRTYVRNGSVCHLGINQGVVDALVVGSELYSVKVKIKSLDDKKWTEIKKRCKGQVSSLLELLQGTISDQVMRVVADETKGLFPLSREISFTCSCPDWADMCKHVAAVLYGVGARLDDAPDLLFTLRGVDPSQLINAEMELVTEDTSEIGDDDLGALFGIEMDAPQVKPQKKTIDFTKMTGKKMQAFRKKKKMSVQDFCKAISVTAPTVYRWEATRGKLKIREAIIDRLNGLS